MCSNTESGGGAPYSLSKEQAATAGVAATQAGALDHYRMQLYNYAVAERLRLAYPPPLPPCYPGVPYPPRLALSMSLFHHRALALQPEEPKPQHSYIGLIAMAILSHPECKLVLSDIYQHILDNYPYFRSRGPGWRNSIRHNLSLNDCFVKAGRSANGKGHYWAIHPANVDDFRKGDFRRRKAQRKVRKHMGLAVDDDGADSPSPPPLSPPTLPSLPFCSWSGSTPTANPVFVTPTPGPRKRQFDVASLLAPDADESAPEKCGKRRDCSSEEEQEEDIDVVASEEESGTSPRLVSPAAHYPVPAALLSQWGVFPGGVFGVEPAILGRYYEQLAAQRRRPPAPERTPSPARLDRHPPHDT